MCAITGIFGEKISAKLHEMLLSLKHRGPDMSGVYVDGIMSYGKIDDLEIPEGKVGLGHNFLSIPGSDTVQLLNEGNIFLACDCEIYNYKKLRDELVQTFDYDFKTDSNSEIVLALIMYYYDGHLLNCIPPIIKRLDGDYAFAVYDEKNLVVVRDPLGVKPIYYGSNNDYFGFASERKALWKVGIDETHSLPPNHMLHNQELVPLKNQLFMDKSFSKGRFSENKADLKNLIKESLIKSVEKRVNSLKRVGIPFSGGVDSTLLVVLCNDLGVETELYTVGSEGSPDLNFAMKVAEHMGHSIHTRIVDEELVRNYTPLVLNAIEEWNLMKLGVGMTAYLAAEMARENGIQVLLSGQGADELLAGYHRYLNFNTQNKIDAQKNLENDVKNLYHVNLERDEKVSMAHSVELRVPYLDLNFVNITLNTPLKYKIHGSNDRLRKCILREVAKDLGVPQEIVKRPKKAAQYGSGIHKILTKKILKDEIYMQGLKNSFNFIDI